MNTRYGLHRQKSLKRTRLKRKASKLAKAKGCNHSRYWRNKADAEVTRLFRTSRCMIDGCGDPASGHHLISKARSGEYRHELRNIVPLCPTHHTWGNELAAHSKNSLAVKAFVNWVMYNRPSRYMWWTAHDNSRSGCGTPDYRAAYERLVQVMELPSEDDLFPGPQ